MRKTKKLTITAEGRDKGKAFILTEMPAMQGEEWAHRAVVAIARTNPAVSDDMASTGMAGFATLGLRALASVSWEDAEPLLDQMLTCIAMVPDASKPAVTLDYPAFTSQIEEVSTILLLRSEVIELHTGFSVAAGLSSLGQAAKAWASRITPTSQV